MIVTENIQINTLLPVDNEFIENELVKAGIDPIRWAVTEVNANSITVCVSYKPQP